MKRTILTVATILITGLSMAQWNNNSVDNGLDNPYRICHTKKNNGSILKLENAENSENEVLFYIQGTYFCSDFPYVEMSFFVNKKWVKYITTGFKNSHSDVILISENIELEPYFKDFLNSSYVKIRVNEEYCTTEIYEFNMSGSTSAFNFIKKQL